MQHIQHTILILLFALTTSFCDESYIYRDISKPIFSLKKNCQIIQFGPARTGSTLIFNILKYLFEDTRVNLVHLRGENTRVHKTHSYNKEAYKIDKRRGLKPFIVITIRHPLASVASFMKLMNYDCSLDDKHFLDKLTVQKNMYSDIYNNINGTFDPEDFICLYYETFVNDFDYIFSKIEAFFEVIIPEKEKTFIRKTFNKESISKHIQHLSGFNKWDSQTHFHGNHITDSSFSEIKDENLKNHLKDFFSSTMQQWGYSPDID